MLAHKHPELRDAAYIVFVDSNRRYIDCTPGVSELLGYTREEMLLKTIDDISYDVSSVPELFTRYLQSGEQQGEYILQRKNRTPLLIWYRAFVFHDGCNAAIWEPIRDWREHYLAALLELEPQKQKQSIDRALAAISQHRSNDSTMDRTLNEAALLLKSMQKRLL
jgi:hypothetical protein